MLPILFVTMAQAATRRSNNVRMRAPAWQLFRKTCETEYDICMKDVGASHDDQARQGRRAVPSAAGMGRVAIGPAMAQPLRLEIGFPQQRSGRIDHMAIDRRAILFVAELGNNSVGVVVSTVASRGG